MQITREGGRITLRDRPSPYWALGLFLLAGGVLAVAMSLGLATNAGGLKPWERIVSLIIGLGVSAAALWWLARNPGTEVQLDLTRRSVRLVRRGIRGRQVRQLGFDQLLKVELEQGADNDGDPVWRPALRLRTGELVPLSQLWSHDQAGARTGVAAVTEACRLP